MTTPLREEFEKEFNIELIARHRMDYPEMPFTLETAALWAAIWMAERCSKEVSGYLGRDCSPQDKIRKLIKDLES